MLRQDDFQKSMVVQEAWRQGLEYGGHMPSILIMHCLANRFRKGWGTWLDILNSIPKYSAELVQPNRDRSPDIWEPSFIRLLHAVDGVYDGSTPDITKGSTYWCDTRRIETDFFKDKILKQPQLYMRAVESNTLALFSADAKLWNDPTHGAGK